MGGLRAVTALREFTISRDPAQIVAELLDLLGPEVADRRQVIGFGVYIWNTVQTSCQISNTTMANTTGAQRSVCFLFMR